MSICQQRAAPCNFRPREFWPSQTTTCPGLPPRSSIYLAARELCPKCPSEFSFAQLSPCSQNSPPPGWIRSQPREEKFRKPHPGSSVHFKWWAMRSDSMDFCSAQITKISRQKEHQRSQILWGWFFSWSSRNNPPALGGHPQKGWKCRKQEVASRGLLSPGTRDGSPRLKHSVRVFLTGCGLLLNGNNIMDNNRNRWEYTGTPR